MSRLWDTRDIARYLGCSRSYACRLCREGSLRAIRIGQEWRTTRHMVDKSLGIEEANWRSNER